MTAPTRLPPDAEVDHVRPSRARIAPSVEESRRWIERDLHDGAQQRLVCLGLAVHGAAEATPPELTDLRARLRRINRDLAEALDELRRLALGIHPPVLTEAGLDPALRALARISPLPVELHTQLPRRLAEQVEIAAYYLVSEALANAAKHSEASVVRVDVEVFPSTVVLDVCDDGVGGADPAKGSGLVGLRDRVELLGGTIELSSPPGAGTAIRVILPLAA